MSEEDIDQARSMAGKAAELVFSRLGPRPFHPRFGPPDDEKLAALLDALCWE
jgi:hypothetical protein